MAVTLPERALSLSEHLSSAGDRAFALAVDAANERRPHARTEQLLDATYELGMALCRAARGGRP